MKLRRRRRRVLVDRLQYKLLGFSLAYMALTTFTFAVAAFGPLILDLDSNTLTWEEKRKAADVFLTLHSRVWIPVTIMCLILIAHATRASHRIAGPLYRFRQAFEAIGKGNLSQRIVLRAGDYLDQDADALNGMILGLNERIGSIRERRKRVGEELRNLEQALGERDIQELTRATEQLREQLNLLDGCLGQFRLSQEVRESMPLPPRDAEERERSPVLPA